MGFFQTKVEDLESSIKIQETTQKNYKQSGRIREANACEENINRLKNELLKEKQKEEKKAILEEEQRKQKEFDKQVKLKAEELANESVVRRNNEENYIATNNKVKAESSVLQSGIKKENLNSEYSSAWRC